tara:strand:+ start:881 stop:1501 length:621 start_codon:yes stop_codon:yes gene_type:complete
MNYKEYINAYLDKGSFYSAMSKKELIKEPTTLFLLIACSVTSLIAFFGLFLTQYSMMFGNILFVIFLAISLMVGYTLLYIRFTRVLIAYEKDNKIYWEFVIIPKEYDKQITDEATYQIGEKNKFLKVLIRRNENEFDLYNPFEVITAPVNTQELAAINEQSALKRLTTYVEKSTAKEMLEKGALLIILGGMGFLIFVLVSNILNKV